MVPLSKGFLILTAIQYGCYGLPIDQRATLETKNLYSNLLKLSRDDSKFMFGMQGSTQWGEYGGHSPYHVYQNGNTKGWAFTSEQAHHMDSDDLCDVCSITNQHPGIMGMDFRDLTPSYIDTVTYLAHKAYARGEVITFSWHHSNPVTGGPFYIADDQGDVAHSIQKSLPGGPNHVNLTKSLDKIAEWALNFKDPQGKHIPVIFRPYHEMNGRWFFWGMGNAAHNTPDEYKKLWQFLVHYLRDIKHVHNFLYAYSPGWVKDNHEYMLTYPGDDYVDVVGQDYYYSGSTSRNPTDLIAKIESIVDVAKRRNKIAAVTEFGSNNPTVDTHPNLWMDLVLKPMKESKTALGIAYLSTWINRCSGDGKCGKLYTPYKGHPAADDFLKFFNDPATLWGKNIPNIYS
ncbi:mannan endo-1,4-beta-mannosidase-like [Haliotis cracherodii]|uniref:mannan endo-1,4-beta-mannosidase-like n=1 Tax=Haliotis cracherodii TaxID=6455 RepID=UPI0039ED7640